MCRRLLTATAILLLGGCRLDRTITHGADGRPEWDRRLQAAVPVGMAEDAARSLMHRNGFRCETRPAGLSCEKWSRNQGVRRHWMADLRVRGGRVTEVRSNTGIVRS